MTEEYELSTYDRHELNYNQIALSRLPISIMGDYTIQTIRNSTQTVAQLLIYVGAINVLIIFAVIYVMVWNSLDYKIKPNSRTGSHK
uniref:Uncharacterized protein n=1 Tax=Oryza glumipatula TaxID=40148 RepID=A0A0D9Y430_9ORYZ